MTIYFAFSDENGSYKRIKTAGILRAHPWYIRSVIVINAEEWKFLESNYLNLKFDNDLPKEKEIKWSYLWSLKKHKDNNVPIQEKHDYYFLKDYDLDQLQNFIFESVKLLTELKYCKVVTTVTQNSSCPQISESRLLKMHLQESMQRIEMDMQTDNNNLCILFIDPVSEKKDKALRESYSSLYNNGDIINRYRHIKDSLNIEHSHHSVGIQLSDFIAGSFGSLLNRRPFGKKIFHKLTHKIIRKSSNNNIAGYGIREVPSNKGLRQELGNIIYEKST